MLPIFNTFVHFHDKNHHRHQRVQRSKSAPPEHAKPTAIRQQEYTDRSEVITARTLPNARWPAKRILRRWLCLFERFSARHHEETKLKIKCDLRCARLEPQLRIVLPMEAYAMFLHIFEGPTRVAVHLEELGLIRDSGKGTVELWCAADSMKEPMMQMMLEEARQCRDTYEWNQIRVAKTYSSPLVMKLRSTLTLQELRQIVEKKFGLKPGQQILQHKGQVLCKRGLLYDLGVRRGSVIRVSERMTSS